MAQYQALTGDGNPVIIEDSAVQALQSALRGELLRAGDAGYDEARQLWNRMFDKHPALIARCTGTADVVATVDFARQSN
jgi:hypothetical protein